MRCYLLIEREIELSRSRNLDEQDTGCLGAPYGLLRLTCVSIFFT